MDDIPADELLKHDLTVDVICTPTRVIRVPAAKPKPTGIYWDLLSPEKLSQVRGIESVLECCLTARDVDEAVGEDPIAVRVEFRTETKLGCRCGSCSG